MKICILHRYPPSLVIGTNPSFPLFVNKLISREHEVIFISFKETENNLFLNKILTKEINLTLNRASTFDKIVKSLIFVIISPFIVRRIHQNMKLDLVYCDDSMPFYGYLIKKIARTKTIMRLGDLQSAYIFADESYIKKQIFKFIFSLEKKMWKSVDKVVVISEAFKNFLIENSIPPHQIETVQECIDLEMFRPFENKRVIRTKYEVGDSPLVMFHGLVAKMKGLDTLLKAIPYIIKEMPDTKFMIIGEGGELGNLKKLANKLKIGSSVIFTGWVPFTEIPNYISECDIGVPCRSGNLGNNFVVTTALLQYWAMEKPVVAPNLAAIANIFEDGKVGLLFEPDNPQDLSNKIIYLLKNNLKARQMGKEGKKIAERLFNIELVSENMLNVLCKES